MSEITDVALFYRNKAVETGTSLQPPHPGNPIAEGAIAGSFLKYQCRIVGNTPQPLRCMDAFAPNPPDWTQSASHAHEFCCPSCRTLSSEAEQVWINRRSPVYSEDRSRRWQEFYQCSCSTVWWAWSSDRPPTTLKKPDLPPQLPWENRNLFDI